MQIVFNSSGTHIHKDALKIRLDLYPSETDKSYAQNYIYVPVIPAEGYQGKVYPEGTIIKQYNDIDDKYYDQDMSGMPIDNEAYDKWIKSLPHIWKLNPCLSVFVKVDENITKELLTEFCGDIYKSDVLATIDDALIQSNSAHLISPYMKSRVSLSVVKTTTFDAQSKSNIDTVLKDFAIGKATSGLIEKIEPKSIDVGPGAIDLASLITSTYTLIDLVNPSNGNGVLDTIEFWFDNSGTGVKAGTFYGSSTSYTSRDYESIGSVTAGAKRTFTGLDCDISSGDFLGVYYSGGMIDRATSGGTNVYTYAGDAFGAGTKTYSGMASHVIAIYGTGTESGGGTIYPIFHKIGSGIRTGIGSGIA